MRPLDRNPSQLWAILQTDVALTLVFAASRTFVSQFSIMGPALGIPAQLVALLLSPVATEMPETMNAVIWVRQGKERLALANISGAMMIQATIPTTFGLFYTSWLFDPSLVLAGGATITATALLFFMFRGGEVTGKKLTRSSLLYLLFAGAVLIR